MKILILLGGVAHIGFAIFHLFFWRLFRWKIDLARLTFTNRAVMQILNLCLTFVFLLIAFVSFFHVDDLLTSSLGRSLLLGTAMFWFLRLIQQFVFFGIRTWRSNAFAILFMVTSLLYLLPAFS